MKEFALEFITQWKETASILDDKMNRRYSGLHLLAEVYCRTLESLRLKAYLASRR